ncbi:MAG: hypothetical protein HW416_3872 [Chloroflexi bacterium]|nr:hypothetical protein [Chloroflexota bacterium]
MATIQETMTLDEFLALPEEKPALEYEYGRVTQKVPPDIPHSSLQPTLAALFNQYGGRERLVVAFTEARWNLPHFSRVPDVVVYRRERLPLDERGRLVHGAFKEPPDVLVEIVSPGQTGMAQLRRCVEFVAAGVPLALIVDSDDESVTVVHADERVRFYRGAERIDLDQVVPGFELTADQLFATLSFA